MLNFFVNYSQGSLIKETRWCCIDFENDRKKLMPSTCTQENKASRDSEASILAKSVVECFAEAGSYI